MKLLVLVSSLVLGLNAKALTACQYQIEDQPPQSVNFIPADRLIGQYSAELLVLKFKNKPTAVLSGKDLNSFVSRMDAALKIEINYENSSLTSCFGYCGEGQQMYLNLYTADVYLQVINGATPNEFTVNVISNGHETSSSGLSPQTLEIPALTNDSTLTKSSISVTCQ